MYKDNYKPTHLYVSKYIYFYVYIFGQISKSEYYVCVRNNMCP